ncbi:MAG TPA: methyltransferase domain-containing protein [Micavibrio sp.]|nr:methyltransferase domain-containing protein [Micavibrio sp.]
MDDTSVPYDEFRECLINLERINILTLAYRPVLRWLQLFKGQREKLVIVDAGCGGGDMLRRIAALTIKNNMKVALIGVDVNPWSRRAAESMDASPHISYETADIFALDTGRHIDIILSSLFTHHLADREIIDLLKYMHQTSKKGWMINDLHRHPVPYFFIKTATRLFFKNRLTRHDAAISVARSFTRKDWEILLGDAGIARELVKIEWHFPFRYCVSCVKP